MTCRLLEVRVRLSLFFFFNDTATTEIYTLSLHDALPIYRHRWNAIELGQQFAFHRNDRSEEHTSELQSLRHLVCRLLLEKEKKQQTNYVATVRVAALLVFVMMIDHH